MPKQFSFDTFISYFSQGYIPFLAACCLAVLLIPLKDMQWKVSLVRGLGLLTAALVAFGLYQLEVHYGVWRFFLA